MGSETFLNFLILLPTFIISLSIHEWAHAYASWKLGDDLAKREGRMTINPASHIDPLGTLMLPALGLLGGGFIIGWAKPVPVDLRSLKNPSRDFAIIAFAGPLSNLAQAIFSASLLGLSGGFSPLWQQILLTFTWFNIAIAFFNLLPIPPLDGSRVLAHFLPPGLQASYRNLERYGFMILLGLIMVGFILPFNPIGEWIGFWFRLVWPFFLTLMGG